MTLTRDAFRVFKSQMKHLRGLVVAYKEPGVSTQDIEIYLRLQLIDEILIGFSKKNHYFLDGLKLKNYYPIHTAGSGLLLLAFGQNACKNLRYFTHAEQRYKINIRMGQSTNTLNSDGSIVDESRYDHVDRGLIDSVCAKFVGHVTTQRAPYVIQPKMTLLDEAVQNRQARLQNGKKLFKGEIIRLECTEFDPPHLQLDMLFKEKICPMAFSVDLLRDHLQTCGHVTSFARTSFGPFDCNDSLPSYKLSYPLLVDFLDRNREKTYEFLKQKKIEYPELDWPNGRPLQIAHKHM